MSTVSNTIMRLQVDNEGFYDSGWDCERSYYFVRDAAGNRYSQRTFLPSDVWTHVYLTPLDKSDYGYTMDDEVQW